MRRQLLGVAVALLAAGCLAPAEPPGGPVPDPLAAADAPGGWRLDCTLGDHERALGGPWPQDCLARASHSPGAKQEIWLALNPTDPRNVVLAAKDMNPASSRNCVWNGLAVTKDGGATWHDVVIGGAYADRRPGSPYWGYACNTDPMMAFAADGTLHFAVEVYNLLGQGSHDPTGTVHSPVLPGWKVVLATSRDGGLTWPDGDAITFHPDLGTWTDYQKLVVSPATGTILETINNLGTGFTCHVLASRDGGRTAHLPVKVTPLQAPGQPLCLALAAAPDEPVVVVGFVTWFQGDQGRAFFVRSADDGRTFGDSNEGFAFTPLPDWSTQAASEEEFRKGTNFELAYDTTQGRGRGTLHVIYADASEGHGDVFVRRSADHGRTWGEPVRVNDDATGADQFLPNIAVAPDGSLHAFFLDRRWDPEHRLLDVTHAVSLDGGATWHNRRVTTASFDGNLGVHQEGRPFIGDYLGIGAAAGPDGLEVWGGFPDSSLGGAPVMAAARLAKALEGPPVGQATPEP